MSSQERQDRPKRARVSKGSSTSAVEGGKPQRTNAKPVGARPVAKVGKRPHGKGGSRPNRRIAPVKVNDGRNWMPVALFTVVGLIAVSIIGYAGWSVYQNGLSWSDRAARIDGIVNWRERNPDALTADHKAGVIDYSTMPMKPPAGGNHNANWQRCQGDVYEAAIATEHAIHSMEHGAAWITYQPGLAKEQVDLLANLVRGTDYRLMSPFEGQDAPISLQVWGYQLKVDNARDARIATFLSTLAPQAAKEQGATCSSGAIITETGTTPRDLSPPQQQPGAGQMGGADPDGGNHGG
ncbi:DUF3105 domain-containing protein [Dactylosporangium sucinum]|nr:DUF3105 domain-containing protein [Dactylosporangium sucinum]